MHKATPSFIWGLLIWGINSPDFAISYNPEKVFPITVNPIKPSSFWLDNKKPFPTNAWFTNFVLLKKQSEFSDPVNIFPYLVRISNAGISLSYSAPIYYANPLFPKIVSAFYYQFENQISLGAVEQFDDYGVASYHGLAVNLEWRNKHLQKINAPIVQGSPYLSEFFTRATPQILSRFKWIAVNSHTQSGPLPLSNRYELVLVLNAKQTQTWVLYSEKPISFTWSVHPEGQRLTANAPYTGWVRLILQKDNALGINNEATVLDAYSQTIPLDYKQSYFSNEKQINYSFSWQTQNKKPPLMLSLPHHRTSLLPSTSVMYSGIKGLMLGETSTRWTIALPKVAVLFIEPKYLSPEKKNKIREALQVDAAQFIEQPFLDEGPYLLGKRYARIARLILIAHQIQEYSLQKKMLKHLESLLTRKILTKSTWHFEYDTTWGGVIPSVDNYGARHYNDHHYHYGYWVYTFAVIAQFDGQWLNAPFQGKSYAPQEWIKVLIDDYANQDTKNTYFPMQRYQDDYAGHSWASGLTSFKDGQNQQSSSEAVNAYYALALYAKAVKNPDLFAWAAFLMARELKSAQTYWHIAKSSTIYSPQFTEYNQVVADLWGSKIDSNTFFTKCKTEYRCGLEYAFGIQMLPFTAISHRLIDQEWIQNAYPTLKKIILGKYGTISPQWKWLLIKGMSGFMEQKERDYYFQQAHVSSPQEYDNGDSKTNTLYFLADE